MERKKLEVRRLPLLDKAKKRTIPLTQPMTVGEGRRGTKPGYQRRFTGTLKDAILYAARLVGEDGKGKNALYGYLTWLARNYPALYVQLLGKLIPYVIQAKAEIRVEHRFRTPEEVRDDLAAKGIYIDRVFE